MVAKSIPRASTRNLRLIPGRMTKGVHSIIFPARTSGVMERTVRKVAAAPRTDQASRRLGFLPEAMIRMEAREAIKTATKGLLE